MRKVIVVNNVTLDGVMQAPAGPDEDRRDGFEHGGWAAPYFDDVMGRVMGEHMAHEGALLFGRRTYDHMASFWPHQTDDNPFTPVLNARTKYVVSRTLADPLPWQNSKVLTDADAVEQLDGRIAVLGSGELIQSLLRRDLVDEFLLSIHPVVLGSGRKLFPDGSPPATLRLADTTTTTTGVVIATYQRSA